MKYFILPLLLMLNLSTNAQVNLDSLSSIWMNTSVHDTIRMASFVSYIENNNIDTEPSKARVDINKLMNFAEARKSNRWQAEAFRLLGKTYYNQYKYDDAIDAYEKALILFNKNGYNKGAALVHSVLGYNYFKKGEWGKASLIYNKGIVIGERYELNEELHMLNLKLGQLYMEKSKPDSALIFYEKSKKFAKKIAKDDKLMQSKGSIASLFADKGDFEEAIKIYKEVVEYREKNNVPAKALALGYARLGYYNYQLGSHAEAMSYYLKCLKLREETNDIAQQADCHQKIGDIFSLQNDKEKALNHFIRAVELCEDVCDLIDQAGSLSRLGMQYYYSEDYKSALEVLNKAIIKADSSKIEKSMAYMRMYLGKNYQKLGDLEASMKYLKEAEKMSLSVNSIDLTVNVNTSLARLHYELGNTSKAIKHGEIAIKLASPYGETVEFANALEISSQAYGENRQFSKAFEYLTEFLRIKDTLRSDENQRAALSQEYQYAYEKAALQDSLAFEKIEAAKNLEIEKKNANLKQQRLTSFIFIGGFVLMLLIAFVIFRNQRKQKRLKEEISVQAQELQATNIKLKELDSFKEGMTSMIVHDLKNPLNAIVNAVNIKDKEHQIETMQQSGQMMLSMVMDILDVSKYEKTKMTLSLGSRNIAEMANEVLKKVQFLADKKGFDIKVEEKSNLDVHADGEVLERIITNLLTNAIKYTPIGGEIKVIASEYGDDMVKVSVSDTGKGIEVENIKKVFEQFGQIEARKSGDVRSTGLGLTFCKMAVEAHGGEIGVESEPGKGSTFWFTMRKSDDDGVPVTAIKEEKKHTTWKLSQEEIALMNPFIEELKLIPIYNITAIRSVMKNIESEKESSIAMWKKELQMAINTGNEGQYNNLLSLNSRI